MRKRKAKDLTQVPAVEKLETELKREKYRRRYLSVLRSTVYTLLVVAAAAVLIATAVLGELALLYGVVVAWLLVMAVYYTVRLM